MIYSLWIPSLFLLIIIVTKNVDSAIRNQKKVNDGLLNQLHSMQDELTAIRRDIHVHPETAMTEVRTAAIVAA